VSRTLAAFGALAAFVGSTLTIAISVACSSGSSHIFIGRIYDDQRQCLGDTASIDVVSGKDPGLGCDPTCLIGKLDETSTVYVSTECAPFPMFFDTSGKDARCAGALAASTRDDICNADGGSSNPVVVDAGTGATPDATADATADATND
jgi:hypothetical protein